MPEYTDAVKAVLKVILEEHTRLVDEMNVVKSGLEYEAMCDLEEELRDGIAEIEKALEVYARAEERRDELLPQYQRTIRQLRRQLEEEIIQATGGAPRVSREQLGKLMARAESHHQLSVGEGQLVCAEVWRCWREMRKMRRRRTPNAEAV